ncbi:MAG: hypothetical protein U0793_18335 [Gemmataceae bacterium]
MKRLALFFAFLFAGCGGSDKKSETPTPTPAPRAGDKMPTPRPLPTLPVAVTPADYPDDVPLYPGAKASLAIGAKGPGGGEGRVFNFQVPEPADKVIAFYKSGLTEKGWTVVHESSAGRASSVTAQKGDMVCNVTALIAGPMTQLSVVVGKSDRTEKKTERPPEKEEPTKAPLVVGGDLPKDLPKDVPIYVGAKLETAFKAAENSGLKLTTGASVEKVNAFYTRAMKEQGWKETERVESEDAVVLSGEKGGSRLNISITRDGGDTTILVIYGKKK